MGFWVEIVESLYPHQCVACDRKGAELCALCERDIVTHPVMLSEWQVALFEYRQPIVKKAIQELKYRHRRGIAEYFGNALYREFFATLARKPAEATPVVLVPIPGSVAGNARRGYNHAGEISVAIEKAAAAAGLDFTVASGALEKTREAGAQAQASGRDARELNVEGLFAVANIDAVRGKHVVIVDDVITTGETMCEARRVLERAGAKKVVGVAVAH